MAQNKKKVVVLTGAGISAESGLRTFRDTGGLWEGVDMMEVASVEGWYANKERVIEFYNVRRKQAFEATPNTAHFALAELEKKYDVQIITQNVDSLHEKAGSSNVLHLHGKLSEVKSEGDESIVIEIGNKEIKIGDLCEKGHQLRPNVVWFGEAVPEMENAAYIVQQADYFLIVGTSLVVYPAASLVDYVPATTPVTLIDPNTPDSYPFSKNITIIQENASKGVPEFVQKLMADHV